MSGNAKSGGHHALGPRAYLESRPSSQSIRLGGRYINLSRMAEDEGFDHSYLSRIMCGERTPSVPYLTRIAECLSMTRDDLLTAIDIRKEELRDKLLARVG